MQVQVREVDLASTTLDEPNMMLLLLPKSTIHKLLISQGIIIVNFVTALIFLIVVIIRMDWQLAMLAHRGRKIRDTTYEVLGAVVRACLVTSLMMMEFLWHLLILV